jgi:hypothetical protein
LVPPDTEGEKRDQYTQAVIDGAWSPILPRTLRSTVLIDRTYFWNMPSAGSVLRGLTEIGDVLPHHLARHVVSVPAGGTQPTKEVSESPGIGAQGVGRTPTSCQVQQKVIDLNDWCAVKSSNLERNESFRSFFDLE